jgi:hypothetical protein
LKRAVLTILSDKYAYIYNMPKMPLVSIFEPENQQQFMDLIKVVHKLDEVFLMRQFMAVTIIVTIFSVQFVYVAIQ